LQADSKKDGAISIELFKKFGQLSLFDSKDGEIEALSYCLNVKVVGREVFDVQKGKAGGNKNNRYNNKPHHQRRQNEGDDNDFSKGQKTNYNRHNNQGWNNNEMGSWKQEDTAEKAKLREKAIVMQKKVMMEKNENQKIRLILNIITPDNYEKKFNELRAFLFEELKT